jgi:hypothetical protein
MNPVKSFVEWFYCIVSISYSVVALAVTKTEGRLEVLGVGNRDDRKGRSCFF